MARVPNVADLAWSAHRQKVVQARREKLQTQMAADGTGLPGLPVRKLREWMKLLQQSEK